MEYHKVALVVELNDFQRGHIRHLDHNQHSEDLILQFSYLHFPVPFLLLCSFDTIVSGIMILTSIQIARLTELSILLIFDSKHNKTAAKQISCNCQR